jgi:hypothetical protein
LTLLVVIGIVFPLDAIRDAVTGGPISDARLERDFWYSVLGPMSSVLDAMTLFTVGQIIGFTIWLFGAYGVTRYVSRRRTTVPWRVEGWYGALALLSVLVVYAAAAILKRPMAQLIITRSDVVAVDFHAHTKYSHDGRFDWSAADVAHWHEAAGFNAVYITDHATFEGVSEGLSLDSTVAGQGTMLLPGLEAFYDGEHVNVLNAGIRFRGLTTADYRDIDTSALRLASTIPGIEPVLVQTIPANLAAVRAAGGSTTAGVRAIEIVDGSPRGMSQTRRDHDRIVHLADSLDLALVAGSDNHGWGRTAPGWTLVRIPSWRGYPPNRLADQIEAILRLARRNGTLVIERRTANASPLGVALTLPVVAITVARTLSGGEQVAWIVWIWVPWLFFLVKRRIRA